MAERGFWRKLVVNEELEALLASAPKPVGSLDYDPWGYNNDMARLAIGACRPVYEKYCRVEAHGLENIPASGRCLVIGNHSGQLPIDATICSRTRNTTAQAHLPWRQRVKNVHGAFHCGGDLGGQRILLVDDVMTTGASLNECARTLKLHGAAQVTVLIVARTPPKSA